MWMTNARLPDDVNYAFLALVPKVQSEDSAPGATRPLSLANTDSKIMATMLRLALEPKVQSVLTSVQAGVSTLRSL